LTDVVARREHTQFRGDLYEEVVVIGSLAMLGLLWITNNFEHSPGLVALALIIALAVLLVARFVVIKYKLRYPKLHSTKFIHTEDDSDLHLTGSNLR
jgi:di/tricarboxylate transporter